MLQILHFNWPWYAAVLAGSLGIGLAFPVVSPLPGLKAVVMAAMTCALLWALASLAVSHWVYDLSPLTRWNWIADRTPVPPIRAVNIHAGFDETTCHLRRIFPKADVGVWDIFSPSFMTERSIARARRAQPSESAASVDFKRLPETGAALDAGYLIFAAHELRSAAAREQFFGELYRVLKPEGTLLLVEHARDWKNFLAYGPGFLHFLPKKEWVRLAKAARFCITNQFNITPFVTVFELTKPPAS